jgi:type II secretory pathway pseudopilin PulG
MDVSSTKFSGHSCRCATLLETIIAMMIFSFFLAAMYRTISYSSASAQRVSQRLYLQMEARIAILDLYSRIQEGIELILPAPGSTLSYLALRDLHSNIHVIYLKKNETFSKSEG